MKNAANLLVFFLIIALSSSCAFGMGQRRCEGPVIAERPLQEICITNPNGSFECFDERRDPAGYSKPAQDGMICTNPQDHIAEEEWIRVIIESCKRGN